MLFTILTSFLGHDLLDLDETMAPKFESSKQTALPDI